MATMTWHDTYMPPGQAAPTGRGQALGQDDSLERRARHAAMTKEVRENHERDD